ncbi:methylenesterol C-methyltransferase 2 [Seminavis robusta]|uniref:Methyltransferase n=1 Tax=Seminavis robusta TaxID=568900 RepID=A0A9N8HNF1_9STRA|nr:methylenesterol C-methyltransferase 2 [Seminavis robusta]|eukprot:Sro815_g206480.1 methylenesterol C-methyltransferase 2 (415) ;mRNA; r:13301-14646
MNPSSFLTSETMESFSTLMTEQLSIIGNYSGGMPLPIAVSLGILGAVTMTVLAMQFFTSADPIGRWWTFKKQLGVHDENLTFSSDVDTGIDKFCNMVSATEDRLSEYKDMVSGYYDLATVFYEWGWGHCFHYANRAPYESFDESLRRHEYEMASKLRVFGKDKNILDVGCGIGGPMRNICRFLECQVTGISINPYQVNRGNMLNEADPRTRGLCKIIQGDYMKMKFEHDSFDGAYGLQATCHAPDFRALYTNIYNVLKPGAYFILDEWSMTDKYDPTNEEHRRIKKGIEEGNALPDLITQKTCVKLLEEVGFKVLSEEDLALKANDKETGIEPWYLPMCPSWNPFTLRFQFTWFGEVFFHSLVWLFETLRIAPTGTLKTQKMLKKAAIALRDGGETGIFSGTYVVVCQKPDRNA